MRVMPAGVHLAVDFRAVIDIVLFMNRQRIHVCPQQHDCVLARRWGRAADQTGHAGNCNAGADVFDAHRLQPLGDELRGLEFLEAQLRVLVEMPPVGDHARHDLVDFVPEGWGCGNHICTSFLSRS